MLLKRQYARYRVELAPNRERIGADVDRVECPPVEFDKTEPHVDIILRNTFPCEKRLKVRMIYGFHVPILGASNLNEKTRANFNIGWDTLLLQLGISVLLIFLGETSRRNLFGKILFELNALFYILGITLFLIFIASFLLSINYGMSYVETSDWGGLLVTLVVAITGIVASLPLGIILALGRRSNMPIARTISTIFIEFWRGIPLITVLFAASVLLPLFLPDGVDFNKLLRALIGVMLFSAAYMAEVVRGGLQAIPRGQFEGASAVGLSYSQSMRLIILPQALTHVIPVIVNTFIGLFKDTTLVLIIGLFDLLGQAQSTIADLYWSSPTQAPSAYLAVGLLFFVFCKALLKLIIQ